LLIVDFAPHGHEFLRSQHQHRRLGFTDEEIIRWLESGGLAGSVQDSLPSADGEGLTIKIWTGTRPAESQRSAA